MSPIAVATESSTRACATLIERIGTPGFLPAVLELCHEVAGASDLAVFRLDDGAPRLLGAFSVCGQGARRSGRHYLQERYYRFDGNLDLARRGQPLCMSHQTVEELPDSGYRAACYESAGVAERLSVLVPAGDAWVFVNAYRPRACAVPRAAAVESLGREAPALAAAMRRHLALCTAPVDPLASMSAREREVIEAILAGESAKQAGRRLGLSPTSVATYRQRAFAKLGVRRQVDLFRRLAGVAD
jgi:DNA-binding CsgD family transcriptional regulator